MESGELEFRAAACCVVLVANHYSASARPSHRLMEYTCTKDANDCNGGGRVQPVI